MPQNCQRSLLLALVTLLLIAAAPAFAASAPPAAAPAVTAAGAPGCGASLDFVADLARQSAAPATCSADLGVSPPQPTPLAGFRGYCRCSCSLVKNCNTSADCGGSACLGGVTCC